MKTLKKHILVLIWLFVLFYGRLNAADDIPLNISPEQKAMMENALNSFGLLESYRNYVDDFSELTNLANLENLPVAMRRTISNVEYTLAISGMVNKGDYADLTVFGRITTPQKVLMFGARGIKFSCDGDFVGDVKLLLLNDVTVPLWGGAELIPHGGFDKETGRGVEKTYVSMDCGGFRELNVVADLVFSEGFIRRVDARHKPVDGKEGRVSCAVKTTVSGRNDILVSVDTPRFAVKGLDGFAFDVKRAVFDFSDRGNDPPWDF